jgi:hypothetical protein
VVSSSASLSVSVSVSVSGSCLYMIHTYIPDPSSIKLGSSVRRLREIYSKEVGEYLHENTLETPVCNITYMKNPADSSRYVISTIVTTEPIKTSVSVSRRAPSS